MCITRWQGLRGDRRELLLFTQEASQHRIHETGSAWLADLRAASTA